MCATHSSGVPLTTRSSTSESGILVSEPFRSPEPELRRQRQIAQNLQRTGPTGVFRAEPSFRERIAELARAWSARVLRVFQRAFEIRRTEQRLETIPALGTT